MRSFPHQPSAGISPVVSQLSAVEILDECVAEDAAPAFGGGRLLRSLAQVFEELGNSAKRPDRVEQHHPPAALLLGERLVDLRWWPFGR